jgi:hypothetical protein
LEEGKWPVFLILEMIIIYAKVKKKDKVKKNFPSPIARKIEHVRRM